MLPIELEESQAFHCFLAGELVYSLPYDLQRHHHEYKRVCKLQVLFLKNDFNIASLLSAFISACLNTSVDMLTSCYFSAAMIGEYIYLGESCLFIFKNIPTLQLTFLCKRWFNMVAYISIVTLMSIIAMFAPLT